MVEPCLTQGFPQYFDHRTSLFRVYLLTSLTSMEHSVRDADINESPLYTGIK